MQVCNTKLGASACWFEVYMTVIGSPDGRVAGNLA